MREGTVYIFKTSPKTLGRDVEKVLNTADFQDFYPEEETFIKINANYDKDWPGCNTSRWFLDALLRNLKIRGFENLKAIEGDLKLQPAVKTVKVIGIKDLLEKHRVPFVPIEGLPRDEYELPLVLHNSQLINTEKDTVLKGDWREYVGEMSTKKVAQKEYYDSYKDFTILEVGCGTGIYSTYWVKSSRKFYGLDISRGMLRRAATKID